MQEETLMHREKTQNLSMQVGIKPQSLSRESSMLNKLTTKPPIPLDKHCVLDPVRILILKTHTTKYTLCFV